MNFDEFSHRFAEFSYLCFQSNTGMFAGPGAGPSWISKSHQPDGCLAPQRRGGM